MAEIDWDQPTHLFGLPYSKDKARPGCELYDTLAACVTHWLSLAGHHRQNCTMSFYENGRRMLLADRAIGRFVERVGLPPAMVAQRGAKPTPEALARIAAIDPYRPAPGPHKPASDASHIARRNDG